jgi:hypothetical protein
MYKRTWHAVKFYPACEIGADQVQDPLIEKIDEQFYNPR